jgi:serine/threonine-protein kinase
MIFRRRLAAAVLLAAICAHGRAHAQDAAKAAQAQVLFDDAVKLMGAGRFAEACPKLATSQQLDPGAGTLLNLGACYEKNGQTASAWATFQEVIGFASRSGHADWATRARDKVAALEPRLVKLAIVVPKEHAAAGLKITRDKVQVDATSWGEAFPVDPGAHEIVATAPNKQRWATTVKLENEGTTETVTVPALEDAPVAWPTTSNGAKQPAPGGAEAPAVEFWSTQRILAAALTGVGIAGVAVGSVLGLQASSKYNDALDKYCPNRGSQCTQQGLDQLSDAHGLAGFSTVSFVVGGAALATGILLFVTAPPATATPAPQGVRVFPSVGTRGASVSVGGAW